jgi:DNA replication protein DnaC
VNEIRAASIRALCKGLKLSRVAKLLPDLLPRASKQGQSYEDFLFELLEAELLERQTRSIKRRLKVAAFPEPKTLEGIEWEFLEGVSRQKVHELCSSEFIDKCEDLILAGPIGTGKSMIATVVGIEAIRRGHTVVHRRVADLVRELIEARDEHRLTALHAQYRKVSLLVLDELGFVPFDRYGAELLFNLLADRYRKRSTAITTNLQFSEWVQVFGCEKMTAALLDRLTHHSHICITEGPSYRSRLLNGICHNQTRANKASERGSKQTTESV